MDKKPRTIEAYIKAYNRFDVNGMIKNLHQEIRFENISNGAITLATDGIEEFRKQAERAKDLFNQRGQKITSLQVDNDKAEVEIDYQGVLAKDLPNGLKAGEIINLKGKSIFYFDNDKIIKIKDIS